MNILESIKSYYDENKQLIIASILSAIVIIALIITISFMKNGNKNRNNNHYIYSTTTTKDAANPDEDDSSTETTRSDEETSELSDLNFTLPQELEEETETTLKDSEYEYMIKVNRAANCVTVYRKDNDGNFTIPHKAMACSTGKNVNNTPTGTFRTSTKHNWRLMVDGTYSQYATRIYNGILFHSVPCTKPASNQLEYEEFNKLGSAASLGCVRLTVADAKWIYDNCSYGTVVEIYDDKDNPGPLGKPSVITIPANSPYKTWDPTDPDPNNPWHKCEPSIEASDMTVRLGKDVNLLSNATAIDTCGNNISSSIKISGTVDKNKEGTYKITYSVTDLLGKSATITVSVKVTADATEDVTTSAKKRSASSNTTAATVSQINTPAPDAPIQQSTTAPYTQEPSTTAPQDTTRTPNTTKTPVATTARQTTPNTTAKATTARPTLPPPATTQAPTTTKATEPVVTTEKPTTTENITPEPVTEPKTTEPPEPTAPSIDEDYGEQETTSSYN